MAILNPVHALVVSFLFVFTIPIAIFASITTTLAFCVLLFRVLVVYAELGFAVIPYYLLGDKATRGAIPRSRSFSSSNAVVPGRSRRRRRGSTSSNLSGSITPVSAGEVPLGINRSVGPARDYEGVGGWRINDAPSDDEALWTKINSRLELPADHSRRHQRSLTSGGIPWEGRQNRSYSPEAMMNTSRARTSPSSATALVGNECYFPATISPKTKKSGSASNSGSVSSTSSKGSAVLSMKQR